MDFFFQQLVVFTLNLPSLPLIFPYELQRASILLRISSPLNICGGDPNSCLSLKVFFCFLKWWLHGRKRLWLVKFFFLCFNLWEYISFPHIRQTKYPLTVQQDKLPFVGKLLILHNRTTHNVMNSCWYASYALTLTSHKVFKSSKNGAK